MSKVQLVAVALIFFLVGTGVGFVLGPIFLKPVNPYDVAIVFATGGLGDKSFNDGVFEGAALAAADFNTTFTWVEPTEVAEFEPFLRHYAMHPEWLTPYKLIIGVGFTQVTAMQNVAGQFPAQKFAIVDEYINETIYPNVASLLFDEEEAGALAGAIAGMYTQTGILGYIGGMSGIPLLWKFAAGFFWGANITRPELGITVAAGGDNVSVAYVADTPAGFTDIAGAQLLADGMYGSNVDIIFAAAGRSGLGVFASAKDNNDTLGPIWVVGVDSPQMYLGTADPDNPAPPTLCLTTALKNVQVAAYNIIRDATQEGATWTPGINKFNLTNGGHDYEENPALLQLSTAAKAAVEQLKQDIINGVLDPPTSYEWVK